MRWPELAFYAGLSTWQYYKYHVWKPKNDSQRLNPDDPATRNFEFYDQIIAAKNPYYAALSIEGKSHFQSRMLQVKHSIEVQGREDFTVTEEVRILICACITQLTFGFHQPHMPFLKGVVVYPGVFYSRLAENWVKGLALGNGVVFISWPDFEEGYHYSTSTYNLGLHEFAHMLRLQALKGGGFDQRLVSYFDDWEANGYEVFKRIRHGHEDFFREYAGENKAEFFSVCIENFFEVPEAFSKELPDVYWHLCHLLRQNPLNVKENYRFEESHINEVNSLLEEPIPTAEPWHLPFELKLQPVAQVIGVMGIFVMLLLFQATNDMEVKNWLTGELRTVLLGIIIIKFFRYFHYKDQLAIYSSDNLNYLVKVLIPVLVACTFLSEIVFGILD